jgi:hypothetical protein
VTSSAQLPLLFLDVDGALLPFGTMPDRIDPAHGPRLMALPCELVWATAWMHDANDALAPLIGLPQLPVVVWPEQSAIDDQDEIAGMHWKTRSLVEWAAGRPFAWVDDEITDTDRAWVSANHGGPALLHRVDPELGLADADFAALKDWLLRSRLP